MIVKLIEKDKLEKRHAYWGFNEANGSYYTVLAIKCYKKKCQYLVDYDMRLNWWDSDLFEIIDYSLPKNWTEIRYKKFYKIKNRNYNFNIPISFYNGPRIFLENNDFFFDIYENPHIAYEFYKKIDDDSSCNLNF